MNPRRRLLTTLSGLALCASPLSGCGLSEIVNSPTPTADGPRVWVLFDPSNSTRPDRGLYLKQFKTLVTRVGKRHGTIRGAALSGNSLATAEWPIQWQFTPPANTNGYLTGLALKKSTREVDTQAARLLAHSEPGTDLLGALQFLTRDWTGLNRDKAGSSHVVVVFSDGIQWTNELRLDPHTLSPTAITRTIRRLKAGRALPDLARTKVYWVGGGLHANLNRQQLQNLQRFWTSYVTKAGGTMASWDTTFNGFQ